MHRSLPVLWLCLAAIGAPSTAAAQAGAPARAEGPVGGAGLSGTTGTTSTPDGGSASPAARQPLWELGLFGITGTQLAYPGSAQRVTPTLVLPYLVYRGPLLRADQGTLGLRAAKTATTELDIGFAGSFGSASSGNRVRRGMPDIGTLVEFGPRLRIDLGAAPGGGQWGAALPLRGVFDLSDGFRYRGFTFEPALSWSRAARGGWRYGLTGSVLIGDERIGDTFYAVDAPFVTAARPAYDARAGLIATRLSFNLAKRLGEDWRAFGYVRVDSVAGAANRTSPLVERREGVSGGVGLAWTWMRSERMAQD